MFPLQICLLPQHFGSSHRHQQQQQQEQQDEAEIISRQILSRARIYDRERCTDRTQGIRAKRGWWSAGRVVVSLSWIFGLRRADVARARSSQCCCCCGNSSDHWSLSQEGTQKGKRTGCHLPGRTAARANTARSSVIVPTGRIVNNELL